MKKTFLSLLLAASTFSAYGQELLEGAKFFDNWSFGVKGGVITPLKHSPFFKSMRAATGVELTKQVTPAFGIGVEGMGYINTSESKTAFDASNVSLLGKVNLMNWWGGYTGTPRVFEIETVAGVGWLHSYVDGPGDDNAFSTKFGLNFNFNMGESRAWTLALKPAIIYNMEGDFDAHKSRFNGNHAVVEITAGLVYHFGNSNGEHHFTKAQARSQAEIDGLNRRINELISENDARQRDLSAANERADQLKRELDDCRNKNCDLPSGTFHHRRFPAAQRGAHCHLPEQAQGCPCGHQGICFARRQPGGERAHRPGTYTGGHEPAGTQIPHQCHPHHGRRSGRGQHVL